MEDEFEIKGNGYFKLLITRVHGFPEDISYHGGYEIECLLEIDSEGFKVTTSEFWASTGELLEFYNQLKKTNSELSGTAYFRTYEYNLILTVNYDVNGHVSVIGEYRYWGDNLKFKIDSDQSYIQHTLIQLQKIITKYTV